MTVSIDALAGMAAIDAANEAEGGGADSGGWDFNQVSALTGSPLGVQKAGLYDPKNPATAATAEELYANRKAAMKAAGVRWGTQAYKDWDAKTRALMGVKPGEKFSSGQWMETFGGMSPSEINAYEGDAYLSPAAKIGMNKFKQDASSIMSGVSIPSLSGMKQFYLDDVLAETSHAKQGLGRASSAPQKYDRYSHVRNLMDLSEQGRYGPQNVQYVKSAEPFWGGQPPGSTDNPLGKNPYTDDPTKQGLYESLGTPLNPSTWKEEQGYFNDLTAAYPSFRAPSPHGDMYSDAGVRRTTFPGKRGEMFGFEEPLTAMPAFYDEETAADFNKHDGLVEKYGKVKAGDPFLNPYTPYGDMKPVGNIDIPITGISGGEFKVGEILPQNYLPGTTVGQYFNTGTFDSTLGLRPDMLKILQKSPESVLIHEKYHPAVTVLALNEKIWGDKIKVGDEFLIDMLRWEDGTTWDDVAIHIAIYAGSQNMLRKDKPAFMNHKIFDDINSKTNISDVGKYVMKVERAKEISHAMNKAARLVLDNQIDMEIRGNPEGWRYRDYGAKWRNPGG